MLNRPSVAIRTRRNDRALASKKVGKPLGVSVRINTQASAADAGPGDDAGVVEPVHINGIARADK